MEGTFNLSFLSCSWQSSYCGARHYAGHLFAAADRRNATKHKRTTTGYPQNPLLQFSYCGAGWWCLEAGRTRVPARNSLEKSAFWVECIVDHLVPVLGAVSLHALRLIKTYSFYSRPNTEQHIYGKHIHTYIHIRNLLSFLENYCLNILLLYTLIVNLLKSPILTQYLFLICFIILIYGQYIKRIYLSKQILCSCSWERASWLDVFIPFIISHAAVNVLPIVITYSYIY